MYWLKNSWSLFFENVKKFREIDLLSSQVFWPWIMKFPDSLFHIKMLLLKPWRSPSFNDIFHTSMCVFQRIQKYPHYFRKQKFQYFFLQKKSFYKFFCQYNDKKQYSEHFTKRGGGGVKHVQKALDWNSPIWG